MKKIALLSIALLTFTFANAQETAKISKSTKKATVKTTAVTKAQPVLYLDKQTNQRRLPK